MALLLNSGDIFLHIPKTGGNWVTHVLQEQGLIAYNFGHKHSDVDHTFFLNRHCNLSFWKYHVSRRIGRVKKEPLVFGVVRHPLRWYESWFKYMSQPKNDWKDWGDNSFLGGWHPNFELNRCDHRDFPSFVRWILDHHPGYAGYLFSRYTYQNVEFVGKQENLATDLVDFLDQTSLEFDRSAILRKGPIGVSKYHGDPLELPTRLKEELLDAEFPTLLRYGY